MKKIVIFLLCIFLIASFIFKFLFSRKESPFVIGEVKRGDIFQIVSVTGEVKKGEEVKLGFEISGKIKRIYVSVGDKVKEGEKLAELDKTSLLLQLEKAKLALEEAKTNYEKLLKGPTKEEIALQETVVSNAEIEVKIAEENLEGGYETAKNSLGDYFLEGKNIFEEINSLYEGDLRIRSLIEEEKKEIENLVDDLEEIHNSTKEEKDRTKINEAISRTEEIFKEIDENLTQIIKTSERDEYKDVMENAKSIVLLEKEKVNSILKSISNLKQNLNSLNLSLELAKGKLETAKKDLQLLLSPPTKEDEKIYQNKIKEAEIEIEILKDKLAKADLFSPLDGEITKIEKKEGELIPSAGFEPFIFVLPSLPYEVEVDIPETEVSKVKIGSDCEITIDALPDEKFLGKLLEIDPAPTVIGGVVYYKGKINFGGEKLERIKSGMTATVGIICERKENVLFVPKRAIVEKENKKIVRIPKGEREFEEVEVKTGLEGSKGEIEIVSSSLKEGDKIILFVKSD